jgi:phytoene dehydrogenase-like protein
MSERYDAVVVGAGLGGLTAAARLIKEGLRVLVVERDPHPGGTAYIFRRHGYGFPMGPMGFSNQDLVQDILDEIGVDWEYGFKRVHYQLMAFGLQIPLSLPFQWMVRELGLLFPQEEAAVGRFFQDMSLIASSDETLPRTYTQGANEFPSKESAAAYLDGLVEDWRLRRILGSMGSREPYSSLPLLAAMWDLLCEKGIHYPPVGMQHFVDSLAGPLRDERGGGRLILNTEAAKIMVEGGRARGVMLSDGTFMEAGAVISNADYKATFLHLMDPDDVPGNWRDAVATARQTMSNLQVCAGVYTPKADLSAFDDASHLIYRRDGSALPDEQGGPDWNAEKIDPHALAGEELELCLLSADDPTLAPPNTEVLVIRVSADFDHFTRFRPKRSERLQVYKAYKTDLAVALLREVYDLIPGLEDALSYMDVATPLTFEERGGRSDGAVAGWSWDFEDSSSTRARELVRTPITGLYMAGYQAFSMLALGGVPSAMLSGLKAAHYLLEGAGPVEEINIPGPSPS